MAAGALNQTPLDWDGNRRNIELAIEAAREERASILCLPELCISGYGCEDAFLSHGTLNMSLQVLQELLPATRDMIVSVGLPLLFQGAIYNAACLIVDQRICGFACKQNLAGEGIHYEPRWFKAWAARSRAELVVNGEPLPIGDLTFQCGDILLGFEICEDAWVPHRPGKALAQRGVDLILNPSASHFAFGKQEVRRRFVLEGSRAFSVSYVYANLLGNEAGRAIYDGGTMIAAGGNMLSEGTRFSYEDARVTAASVDVHLTRMQRTRVSNVPMDIPVESDRPIIVPFRFPEIEPKETPLTRDTWDGDPSSKEEEFARAVPLALFDYLRKSRSRGFVVSLSGGADSSAVASLAWLCAILADDEIGIERLREKLKYIPGIEKAATPEDVVRRLLTCVYQSTRNSSQTTRDAAREVAEGVSAEFIELDVDALVEGYVGLISDAIGRKLTWETDDIALQNIQARTRAPSVWLLANIRGALLLSTSNRSEAAVGYATMDGDTCGGLSPIAGIDKAYLRDWLRWMASDSGGPLLKDGRRAALPALEAVNAQQPTAELRPSEAGQTDEDDLMPYDVLDAIEKAAIRDKRPPLDAFELLRIRFPQYDADQLGLWVERFFRLWTRNQWKRERYAPSFHLDDENLDPKTWCRFPILSGGFERELAELRKALENKS